MLTLQSIATLRAPVGPLPKPVDFATPIGDCEVLESTADTYMLGLRDADGVVVPGCGVDLPAFRWYSDPTSYTFNWYKDGRMHRDDDKPASMSNFEFVWMHNGQQHRPYGLPAVIRADGTCSYWYKNVQYVSKSPDRIIADMQRLGSLAPAMGLSAWSSEEMLSVALCILAKNGADAAGLDALHPKMAVQLQKLCETMRNMVA